MLMLIIGVIVGGALVAGGFYMGARLTQGKAPAAAEKGIEPVQPTEEPKEIPLSEEEIRAYQERERQLGNMMSYQGHRGAKKDDE